MALLAFLRRRLIQILPVLFGILLVVFMVVRLVPGDPARMMLGVYATDESLAELRDQLGLNDPIWMQFGSFLKDVATGDLGISLVYRRPVLEVVAERLAPTITLIAYAVILSVLVCIPLAMLAASRRGRRTDQVIRAGATLTLAMPGFWLGLNLLIVFAVVWPIFPVAGFGDTLIDRLWHLFLPALTITLALAPILIRTLRASIIEAMSAPHVEFARTKGLPAGKLMRRHVLRNALMATVTILGVNIGWLLGGSVVIENVFSIPGIGNLIVSSVTARDYPMIQGIALIFGLLVITINLATDIVYALLDPRVSYD
ncbi:ABC transporter permease [Ponticoccus sp. SC2-23]|uniref:ABC transporter permease n=1 Tax=Alexandriicola marinus TaxID=2081710 RepID=UPI00193B9BA5|nr:ABC transporter permease [Alexandriicola marinus]MBM1221280.1 ABC transporter permease [Ponticoccus sp. SC6-9]MBM1225850.1 ABC transporter permease [Ponticoccus sp. SC6-15]MBM1228002.1 ABC transporter permease [Ponticoccus sp. SC6-38]MBM1234360.1 ABC transporter permease [Ponticoccus sp. SC6-45]MBM1238504.1 ABC transporter permease [Ponticoccus sp. SC6-49]MBM1243773.1 ABC transporter permease [Ponticoccus sp. SC2-64]MBM1247884.1 ABC transporter permease [Ponticoccus sp. SC6-42]MBM1252904